MVLALLLAAASLPFFTDPALASDLGPIDPRPGSWAEYLVRTPGREIVRVRATVFPAEGERRWWLELTAAGESGIASAARILIEGDRPWPANVGRMFVMLAGQQPIELPVDRIRLALPRSRRARTRIWRDRSVPLWGLLKARSPRQSIELVACGASGGRSVFPPGWDQGNGSESAKK
jgi:hypothetical protein